MVAIDAARIVQCDMFQGVSIMMRPDQAEQYFATGDRMYYLIQNSSNGPTVYWLRRNRSSSTGPFEGYAADIKFQGECLNGFVLRSGLYERLGDNDLKAAIHYG